MKTSYFNRKDFFSDKNPIGKLFRDYKRSQDLLILHYWDNPVYLRQNMPNFKQIPVRVQLTDGTYTSSIYNVYAVDKHGQYYEIIPKLTWVSNQKNQVNDNDQEIEYGIDQYKKRMLYLEDCVDQCDELDDLDQCKDQVKDLMKFAGQLTRPVIYGFDINLIDQDYDYYNPHRWDQSTHDYMVPILVTYLMEDQNLKNIIAEFFDWDYDLSNQLVSTYYNKLDVRQITNTDQYLNDLSKAKGFKS